MRYLACVTMILAAGALLAAEAPKQAPADLPAFQGTWTVESAERAGKPDKEPIGDTVTFTQDTMKVDTVKNGQTIELKIKLDASKQPKQIDATHTKGGQTSTVQAIYALENDTLRICASRPDKPRPTDFTTQGDENRSLVVLKRAKKD